MKKITLLFAMFALMAGTSNLNAQVPYAIDWTTAAPPTGWTFPNTYAAGTIPGNWTFSSGDADVALPYIAGWGTVKSLSVSINNDHWLGYHITGLTIGVDYKIDAYLMLQNFRVEMALYAWNESEGNEPDGVTVTSQLVSNPAPVDSAWTDYSYTFTATSATMVVGVGSIRNSGGPQAYVGRFAVSEVSTGPSTETAILTFSGIGETGAATIGTGTIAIEVANGTDVTNLTPTITLSTLATVVPDTGVAQNFTNPVDYTVTAEDGLTQEVWTVTVTKAALNTETDITSFVLAEQAGAATIDAGAETVAIEVVNGTSLTSLTPTIGLSFGATVSPISGAAQDFSGGALNYTVTAEDGLTSQIWAVTVTEAAVSSYIFEKTLTNQTEADAFVAGLPSGGFSTPSTLSSGQWSGTYGVIFDNGESLLYDATGLLAGNYLMEAVIMVRNPDGLPWKMGLSTATPAIQAGTPNTYVTYTENLTLAAGDHAFAINRGTGGFQFLIKEWKLSFLGPTLNTDDAVLKSNFSISKTGITLKAISGNVQIIDLLGRILVSKELKNQETLTYEFNSATIYMVKLTTNLGSATRKVVFK
jgi:hypothetical protein